MSKPEGDAFWVWHSCTINVVPQRQSKQSFTSWRVFGRTLSRNGLTSGVFLHALEVFGHINTTALVAKFTTVKFKGKGWVEKIQQVPNAVFTKNAGSSSKGTDEFKSDRHLLVMDALLLNYKSKITLCWKHTEASIASIACWKEESTITTPTALSPPWN